MKHNDDIFNNDAELRRAFHRELPDAPVTSWFVRKVMNRLPARRRRLINGAEWGAYAVAALILAAYWVAWVNGVMARGVVTVADLGDMALLLGFSLVPVAAVLAPRVASWLRE